MSLRDLHFVAKQLKGVSLRVVAMETTAELSSKDPVALKMWPCLLHGNITLFAVGLV